MTIGLVGRKVGMTRIFTDDGSTLPVTVLDVSDNRITQIKTPEKDGYAAVQVAFGKRRANRVTKPIAGHLAKAGVEAGHLLKEFRAEAKDLASLKVGGKLGVDLFKVGQKVDVQGVSVGKGFAGAMKRWNFGGLRASHGVSISHRSHGSTGGRQDPGKVFKNKKMAGHLGTERVTTLNLKVVSTDVERGLILVEGAVPGAKGGWITVRDAVKKALPKEAPKPGKFRLGEAEEKPAAAASAESAPAAAPAPEAASAEKEGA